jgi:hypothetical protein
MDCSHGELACQGGDRLFVRLLASSSCRPYEVFGWRAQIGSRPARRAAAKRLGLDLSEHAIRLLCSGANRQITPFDDDPRAEPVWQSGFACQIKLTFGRRGIATAPTFRLRRAGSRGRDQSSLRRLKPCNPSVRPPGSTETDRASADWLSFCGEVISGDLHHGSFNHDARGHVLP